MMRGVVFFDVHSSVEGVSKAKPAKQVLRKERNNERFLLRTIARAQVGRIDGQKKKEEAKTLWGILYADDKGIVSRSPKG